MSDWNEEQRVNWIVASIILVLVLFWTGVNLVGPCSWLMWEPVTELPARCLPMK